MLWALLVCLSLGSSNGSTHSVGKVDKAKQQDPVPLMHPSLPDIHVCTVPSVGARACSGQGVVYGCDSIHREKARNSPCCIPRGLSAAHLKSIKAHAAVATFNSDGDRRPACQGRHHCQREHPSHGLYKAIVAFSTFEEGCHARQLGHKIERCMTIKTPTRISGLREAPIYHHPST